MAVNPVTDTAWQAHVLNSPAAAVAHRDVELAGREFARDLFYELHVAVELDAEVVGGDGRQVAVGHADRLEHALEAGTRPVALTDQVLARQEPRGPQLLGLEGRAGPR